ncbi:MAG: glycosyltransferase family 4 protein [Armatimonadota bacterium]
MSEPKLNLLFVQPGVSWKSVPSIERQGLQIAQGLRERGYHITWLPILVHMPEREEDISLIRLAKQEGFAVAPVHLPEKYNLVRTVRRFREHVRRIPCDIVCATGYKGGIVTAFTDSPPTVEVLRGWTGHTLQVRLYEFLDKILLRRHDLIIAVSPLQRDVAIRYGVPPGRVWWIPNAVNLSRMPLAMDVATWKSQLNLPLDTVLIAGVGRLSPEKGYRYLVEAFTQVVHEHPHTRLILAGDGIERQRLQGLVHQLKLTDKVVMLGEIPNGAQLISSARLLVNPSLTEGIPNVILEAFAYKTPVVATAVGGVPELVKDGETGWLVPPRDPRALAQAIREALSNPEEAQRRAENAYRHLLANFTVEKQVERWEQALHAAVENWQKRGKEAKS